MSENASIYAEAGVDTAAGDVAVELMKSAIARTHGPQVLGGVGGFAGLFDATALTKYRRPLLATSTDGVGTKVAIAQAIDKHDTIGQDLVGMVVDDIIVVGAAPLFMTDYIACGRLVPERIADIVRGIALACEATGTALIGGETAEHPGLLGIDEYDVAGAAVGVVEADRLLGPDRVQDGDVVIAMGASGLHSNGYSLVRHILAKNDVLFTDHSNDLGMGYGEALLEPTMLYTGPLLKVLEDPALDGGCTRSATAPAAASRPIGLVSSRLVPGPKSSERRGRRCRCSATSPRLAGTRCRASSRRGTSALACSRSLRLPARTRCSPSCARPA